MTIEMTGLSYQKRDGKAVVNVTFTNASGVNLTAETQNYFAIDTFTSLEQSSITALVTYILTERSASLKTGLLALEPSARKLVTKYKSFFGDEAFKLFWNGNVDELVANILSLPVVNLVAEIAEASTNDR